MSNPVGPVGEGDGASPFPAGYGPVGSAGGEAGHERPMTRTRAGRRAGAVFEPTAATPAVGAPIRPGGGPPRRPSAPPGPPRPSGAMVAVPAGPRRHLLRRFDAWTVFKVSIVFYVLMLIVFLVAGVVAWNVAAGLGFVHDIEKGVRSLADDRRFVLHGGSVFGYTALGGLVLAVVGAILNTVAAVLYNLISDLIGGVQVVAVVEDGED